MKTFSILLYIVAGFFCYVVNVLAFVDVAPLTKFVIMAVFVIPGLISHLVGLAINPFGNRKKTTGVVLLCGAGLTAFVAFTFVSMLQTDEFKKMLKPGSLDFASDYVTGTAFLLMTALVGFLMIRTSGNRTLNS